MFDARIADWVACTVDRTFIMSALEGGRVISFRTGVYCGDGLCMWFRCLIHNVDGDGESVGRQSEFLD